MKIVYFDCFAGISGDMTLGAFLDCGVSAETLRQELEKLGLPGFHLEIEKTKKRGITGTSCRVAADREEHSHRHFAEIREMIGNSGLDAPVKETALAIFGRVAQAEGKVHGLPPEKVHFHEVGAVDSIVDIVGAAICAHAVAADKFLASAVNTGQGIVECAHGVLPVPAPATAEILAGTGFELYARCAEGEAVTPTGAAILAELASPAGGFPAMRVDKVGYGFGEREFEVLNALRIFIGEADGL